MSKGKSRGVISLAAQRLITTMPLYAGILSQLVVLEDNAIRSMAVAFRQGRIVLLYNTAFVESLPTLDLLSAVLAHEIGHIVAGHIFMKPEPGENRSAMVIATETVANDFVPLELPFSPILASQFPMLNPADGTIERYEVLKGLIPADAIPTTLDNHDTWSEISDGGNLAKAVTTTLVAKAMSNLTAAEKKALPKQIRQAGEKAEAEVLSLSKCNGRLRWQQLLRRVTGRLLQTRYSMTRPPRRMPHLLGICKARCRSAGKPRIMAILDISGSITGNVRLVESINSELARLAKTFSVLVVLADDKVRDTFQYRPITNIRKGGCTDFRPALSRDFIRRQRPTPDCIVYFSDCVGIFPPASEKPSQPLIWVVLGNTTPPFGRVIRLS